MRRLAIAATGFALLLAWAPADLVSAQEGGPQAEFDLAASTILCDCGCHPQSVKECACGRAAEMRNDLAALIDRGMTGEAIVAQYVEKFGEQIRIAPTARGFNLVAWLGPLFGLLLATGCMIYLTMRWSRARREEEPATEPSSAPLDKAYQDRLQARLEEIR